MVRHLCYGEAEKKFDECEEISLCRVSILTIELPKGIGLLWRSK